MRQLAADAPAITIVTHPCLTCGACCAHYRVAFHWLEAEPGASGAVPIALAEKLDAHRLVMRGTRNAPTRCVALDAVIGQQARCVIYARRPSVCREVAAAWENGTPSPQCDRARLAHGLSALTPADWPPAAVIGEALGEAVDAPVELG